MNLKGKKKGIKQCDLKWRIGALEAHFKRFEYLALINSKSFVNLSGN